MLTTIISVLISLGYISSPTDYYNLSTQDQDQAHSIVEDLYDI